MWSPPMSRVIAAGSCVDVTMLSFEAPRLDGAVPSGTAISSAADNKLWKRFIEQRYPCIRGRPSRWPGYVKPVRDIGIPAGTLEGMRAMRPHRKLELEQKLVRGQTVGVTGTPELAANLAELARPVGQ